MLNRCRILVESSHVLNYRLLFWPIDWRCFIRLILLVLSGWSPRQTSAFFDKIVSKVIPIRLILFVASGTHASSHLVAVYLLRNFGYFGELDADLLNFTAVVRVFHLLPQITKVFHPV